jgi:hypothetical protein
MESVLRHADATLEVWFRRAKKRSASVLRHRIDDLQVGLKKLSAGLETLERDQKVTLSNQPETEQKVTPRRRTRPAAPRKTSAPRKRKKAA